MINFLRKFINLDDKFEIYTYELSVLINLENKLNLDFLENYVKKINRIEDTNYLTKNVLNDIENDIDKIVQQIINILNSGNLTDLSSLTNEYIEKLNNIVLDKLGNNLLSETTKRYNDSEKITEMTNKYYINIMKIINEYKNSFYDEFRKNIEDEKFITEPTEIIFKLNQTLKNQDKIKEELINQLTKLILYNIVNSMLVSYEKVFHIIEKEHNKIFMEVPKDKYKNILEIKQIIEVFNTISQSIKDKISQNNNLIYQTSNDPFIIENYISLKEKEITNIFSRIQSDIITDFKYQYCKDEIYDICISNLIENELDPISEYNYQMAKLRNAMTHVKNLVPLSKNVITNENSLTNLNSSEIYEKYKL